MAVKGLVDNFDMLESTGWHQLIIFSSHLELSSLLLDGEVGERYTLYNEGKRNNSLVVTETLSPTMPTINDITLCFWINIPESNNSFGTIFSYGYGGMNY